MYSGEKYTHGKCKARKVKTKEEKGRSDPIAKLEIIEVIEIFSLQLIKGNKG